MYRFTRSVALMATAAFLLAGTAHALPAPKVDFTVGPGHPASASIVYNGVNLVGSNLGVTFLAGVGSPLNNGSILPITGGDLDFTTGNVISASPTLLTFGAGPANALTIMGGVAALGLPGGTTLLQGTIQSAQISTIAGTTRAVFSVFVNGIRNEIADYYGFPRSTAPLGTGTAPWGGDVLFGITVTTALNAPFTVTSNNIGSGDLDTTPTAPEPGTLALAGLGVLGAVLYGRRRGAR